MTGLEISLFKFYLHQHLAILYIVTVLVSIPSLSASPSLGFGALRLPYSLSGVFSYQPLSLLIRVGYPQTYISMESL